MAADAMAATCIQCGSYWLDAVYDYVAVRERWASGLSGRSVSLWRYAELLPIEGPDPEISLQEGYTPLLRIQHYERMFDHHPIFIKDERQGPTSSFKDRQAALAVTALKQADIHECVLASTGNAGAAYAAYCARAGIKLWLFMSSVVPEEKMREAALYGAEVVKVEGTYDEVKRIAAEFAHHKGLHLDRGARAIPGKESMKTLAFEIAEQLAQAFDQSGSSWIAPDWYIQAVSGGIGPLGVWKGFQELLSMRLIDKMPRLGIIQAAGCAPMVQAFLAGKPTAEPVTPRTLIHVLSTGDPGNSYVQLRQASLSNQGTMLTVEDGETFAAMRKLASTAGLSVEPAAAVAFAGLERMFYEGLIDSDQIVVVNCSGHTFPAESHVLGDQYVLSIERNMRGTSEDFHTTLQSIDEQATTVLVVDDNPNDRRLLRKLLKSHKHYRVFEAYSGREALRMIYQHAPDLIITDLNMPEMDGITLIEQIKWNPQTAAIPIVVVSARALTADDRRTLESYDVSVWIKGDYESRQLVQHIVDRLGDVLPDSTHQPRDMRPVRNVFANSILVIDADPTSALAKLLSTQHRFNLMQVANGREGLKLIYERHPDVVIFKLHLSDMDDYDFVEMVRADANLHQAALIAYTDDHLSETDRSRLGTFRVRILERSSHMQEGLLVTISEALALIQS
jgi:threonine synthase